MPGCVDQVDSEAVRGWYVSDDPIRERGIGVLISVNGEPCCCALCVEARPDVVANGVTDQLVTGFDVPLDLQPGDLVQVRALGSGRLLSGGLAVVMAPEASDGFLAADPHASRAAYRRFLEPLGGHLTIVAFRPLFGHMGNLSALHVRTPDLEHVVYCQRQNGAWLAKLHREVLEPNHIAAPRLRAVIADGDAHSLVVEPIDGRALSEVVGARRSAEGELNRAGEAMLRASLDLAMTLQRVVWPSDMNVGRSARRGRRAFDKLVRSVCLEALAQRRWPELKLLLRMARVVYRLPRVFSHGDLHAQNVLIETPSGKPVFIDWDHAGLLPVGFDLSRLLLGIPPSVAEGWFDEHDIDSPECRLGWLIMTYCARAHRQPGFHATQEGAYLRRRFEALFEAVSATAKAES